MICYFFSIVQHNLLPFLHCAAQFAAFALLFNTFCCFWFIVEHDLFLFFSPLCSTVCCFFIIVRQNCCFFSIVQHNLCSCQLLDDYCISTSATYPSKWLVFGRSPDFHCVCGVWNATQRPWTTGTWYIFRHIFPGIGLFLSSNLYFKYDVINHNLMYGFNQHWWETLPSTTTPQYCADNGTWIYFICPHLW